MRKVHKRFDAIDRMKEAWGRICFVLPELPFQVQIEVTNRCNLSCRMCPRDVLGVPKEDMPLELFREVIDRIKGVHLVTLTGWGEPFVHPDLFRMIDYCKDKELKVKLTTNGSLVDELTCERIINSGLDSVTFSLEDIRGASGEGHSDGRAFENLRRLLNLRKAEMPEVVIQTTLHQGRKNDLYELISRSTEIGVDRVNLARLDLRFNASLKRPSLAEEKELFREVDRLGREKEIQVDFIPRAVSRGIERFSYRMLRKSLHRFGKYCLRLYDYLYINLKGEVTPCCGLPLYSVGNILKDDLKEIWKGERMKDFRRKQKKICGNCDQWEVRYNKSTHVQK